MKRMRLRKRKKKKTINKIIIILIMIVISIIYIFKIFNEKALPLFIEYSEVEVKKIISSLISNSVNNEVANNIDKDILITTYDNDGNITSIDFNSSSVNKLLVSASKVVEQNLKYLESGKIDKLNLSNTEYDISNLKDGVIYELPSGIIFNNSILSNLFPKIPVKMDLVGNIFCKLNTDIKSYGINNALITINIEIQVDVKILLPFTTANTKVSVPVPVVMKLIEGSVPGYYFNGYLETPTITNSVN